MAFRTDRVHAQHARDAVLGNYGQALELPSYGAAAERRLEVVQGVAYWAERGLVVPAVDREGAGRALDRGGRLGQRHDRPALQQPDQSDLVISRQAAVARVRRRRRLVEAEQILGGPAERLRLLAPAGKEAPAVIDGSLPAVDRNELGAAGFEGGEGTTKTI